MQRDFYHVDRLVIALESEPQGQAGYEKNRLGIDLWIKNPAGSTGSTRRPPGLELRDSDGFVYEPTNEDWAAPLLPDTEGVRHVDFEIAPEAAGLELVLAPDSDEVRIPLPAAA